jgi:hypothetical protein
MEAKQFKSLIKEAVREAVREELGLMLLEQLKSGVTPQTQPLTEGRSMSFDSGDVHSVGMRSQMGNKMAEMFGMPAGTAAKPQSQLKVDPTSDNPFAAFINDTAANLTRSEMNQMMQGG